jgi:hypothetical protein
MQSDDGSIQRGRSGSRKTAKALGLVIPDKLLALANDVVE